ncbi:MAG: hypothetical protein V1732_05075 [Patescibacteria group bacterium]
MDKKLQEQIDYWHKSGKKNLDAMQKIIKELFLWLEKEYQKK